MGGALCGNVCAFLGDVSPETVFFRSAQCVLNHAETSAVLGGKVAQDSERTACRRIVRFRASFVQVERLGVRCSFDSAGRQMLICTKKKKKKKKKNKVTQKHDINCIPVEELWLVGFLTLDS